MNVVLICLDTFRADFLAAAGRNDRIRTPNLDRLAAEGVLFRNAFGEGQPTIQYRRALMTGRRTFPFDDNYDTKGLWPNLAGWHKIPPEQTMLSEALLEAGYTTGFCSDTYHMFKPTQNFTRGFNSWDFIRGQETDNYRIGPVGAVDMSKWRPPNEKGPGGHLFQHLLNNQGRKYEEDYSAAKVFASACRFLDDVRECQPFFLWIDAFDPHEPWDPPRHYTDMYSPGWDEDYEPITHIGHEHGKKIVDRHIANYYGEVTFVDKQVGLLLDRLEHLGVADDTLIVATSDHGTELMDHGRLGKGVHNCRYRHNNEILAVMRLPGKAHAGARVEGLIQNQDFYPTILKACGVAHDPVDGLDLMPLIEGKSASLRDYIVTGWHNLANVRTLEYSYVCNYATGKDETLFDARADPAETANLAADQPEIVKEYRERLAAFLGKLPAELPGCRWMTQPPIRIWAEKSPAGKVVSEYRN